jgi:PAS domain S-box-containing protein
VPIRNGAGRIERWLGTSTDIDDHKRAESEIKSLNETLARNVHQRTVQLQASENRFQWLVEGIQDYAILMLDPDGRVASWTAAAKRIKGYTEEEILGQHFSRFYTAEDIAASLPEQHLQTAAAQGHSVEEGWRVRKDGSKFFAYVQITALRDEAGELRGFSNITRDITERKLAEEELVVARRRAEDANRAKTDFLAVISHEIRTPMNAILGMAEVLSETPLNPEQQQYVGIFRSAGANLLTLINEVLDLSKVESGHFELEQTEFDLEQLTAQAIDLVMPRARKQGIALSAKLDPEVKKRFIGDPTRLRQVLINLLGNALKFTAVGEVTLTVHPSLGKLEFAVSDTGIGIPEEKLQTIFDDFAQASSSTTREYGGTGLGLGISRKIVERMGGRLSVMSVVGEGSTFHFAVRLKAAPEMPLKPPPEPPAIPSQGSTPQRSLRILVAEDSQDNRLLVQLYLKGSGHSLTFADDGKDAVDQFASADFDLVIMDLQMPVMDGLTAVRTIRGFERERARRAVPILALSANARPEDVQISLEAGCNAHLSKPISKQRLLAAVEEYAVAADEIVELPPIYTS